MGGMFDDMDDGLEPRNQVDNAADIRKNAHVANGGEGTHNCPSCGGSGVWKGCGRCFKCDGKGKISNRRMAAHKGKITAARNFEAWCTENAELIDGLRRHSWSNFLAGMLNQVMNDQRKLSDRQIECAQAAIAKADARDAERKAERAKEREAKAKDIGIDAINALFETAMGNGLKAPQFRTERLTIKVAKRHADTLYVTDKGEYAGKIVSGKYFAVSAAAKDVGDLLEEIAKDPKGAAIAYGRSTGICCCCGRELTDAVSVANGIGPICEGKWGL
ncbi:hypothetical protein [Rhizobium phage RHph_X3_2]|nr:hypothetical protein [Rhizobium phage RHph_X3_2]